ncbi:MAG TPA: hypothetical protein VG496_13300 [Myxococcales bacterium]|nr:hypothetical protein [Myxococcales bacterium]
MASLTRRYPKPAVDVLAQTVVRLESDPITPEVASGLSKTFVLVSAVAATYDAGHERPSIAVLLAAVLEDEFVLAHAQSAASANPTMSFIAVLLFRGAV